MFENYNDLVSATQKIFEGQTDDIVIDYIKDITETAEKLFKQSTDLTSQIRDLKEKYKNTFLSNTIDKPEEIEEIEEIEETKITFDDLFE